VLTWPSRFGASFQVAKPSAASASACDINSARDQACSGEAERARAVAGVLLSRAEAAEELSASLALALEAAKEAAEEASAAATRTLTETHVAAATALQKMEEASKEAAKEFCAAAACALADEQYLSASSLRQKDAALEELQTQMLKVDALAEIQKARLGDALEQQQQLCESLQSVLLKGLCIPTLRFGSLDLSSAIKKGEESSSRVFNSSPLNSLSAQRGTALSGMFLSCQPRWNLRGCSNGSISSSAIRPDAVIRLFGTHPSASPSSSCSGGHLSDWSNLPSQASILSELAAQAVLRGRGLVPELFAIVVDKDAEGATFVVGVKEEKMDIDFATLARR
jgi:hypothetical protein